MRYQDYRRFRNRETWRNRYRDPHYRELSREYFRIWYNGRNGTVSKAYNVVDLGPDVLVDRGPFNRVVEATGLSDTKLSRMSGIDDRVFSRRHQPTIRLSTVDKVFTALGRPELLAELYG